MKVRAKQPLNKRPFLIYFFSQTLLVTAMAQAVEVKPKIAIFSGPTATVSLKWRH